MGKVPQERIEKLEELGFQWKLNQSRESKDGGDGGNKSNDGDEGGNEENEDHDLEEEDKHCDPLSEGNVNDCANIGVGSWGITLTMVS